MYLKKIIKSIDPILLIPISIILGINIYFLGTIPYLDGNIDFVQSVSFYNGGIRGILNNFGSIHPPLKVLLDYVLFSLFGVNSISYQLLGMIFSFIGILSIYFICKELFDKKVARISSVLLVLTPLYLSTSIFGMTDFLLVNLVLVSVLFYLKKKFILLLISISLLVLVKETALILPFIILFIEILYLLINFKSKDYRKNSYKYILICLFAFLIFYIWTKYVSSLGGHVWNDWNFSQTADKGAFYTIIYNLISFNFINDYQIQNWRQLFILNFNWIYLIITFCGYSIYLWNKDNKGKQVLKYSLDNGLPLFKTHLVIVLFFISYIFTVLSFQTYTITRYGLPALVIIIIYFSKSVVLILDSLKKNSKILFVTFIILITFSALLSSTDPISKKLWKETIIFNQNFYGLNKSLSGNDGLTYNLQFLIIAKKRSDILKIHNEINSKISEDCSWLFADPNNEVKTFEVLHLDFEKLRGLCTQ